MSQTIQIPISELDNRFKDSNAEDVLLWAVGTFGQSVTLACSFGAEDVALLDILARHRFSIPVFVLDTGRLHEETYDVMQRCRERYQISFEVLTPDMSRLQDLLRKKGSVSFRDSVENRQECCGIRKVEPLERALHGKKAWITGLRRDQSVTRASLPKFEIDWGHGGILKLNPLAEWSEEQLWEYIRENDVPYNALHDKGFPSIGCAPCTRAIQFGEDIRAGRWWWEKPEHKECGLHLKVVRTGGSLL